MGVYSAEDEIIRVGSSTAVGDLAGCISAAVYDGKHVTLRAIGHGAVGQAVKAIAVARQMCSIRGIDLAAIPGLVEVDFEESERGPAGKRTACVLKVIVLR